MHWRRSGAIRCAVPLCPTSAIRGHHTVRGRRHDEPARTSHAPYRWSPNSAFALRTSVSARRRRSPQRRHPTTHGTTDRISEKVGCDEMHNRHRRFKVVGKISQESPSRSTSCEGSRLRIRSSEGCGLIPRRVDEWTTVEFTATGRHHEERSRNQRGRIARFRAGAPPPPARGTGRRFSQISFAAPTV